MNQDLTPQNGVLRRNRPVLFSAGDFVVGRFGDASLVECLLGVTLVRVVHQDGTIELTPWLVAGVEPPFWGLAQMLVIIL